MELDADDEDPLTTIDELAALALLVPDALVAVDVNVYAVPLVSPVMVQLVAGAVMVHVAPPGFAVTVYVAAAPPACAGVMVMVA